MSQKKSREREIIARDRETGRNGEILGYCSACVDGGRLRRTWSRIKNDPPYPKVRGRAGAGWHGQSLALIKFPPRSR